MLNLSSLSTQSLASCVNYFVWNCLTCFSNTKIGSVTSFSILFNFQGPVAPQPSGWRLNYFTTEAVFCQALFFRSFSFLTELGASRKSLAFLPDFLASIGSFRFTSSWDSEVILLSQHLALKYNTCLLYTSDAADDSLRVDLGGRRIIKKRFFSSRRRHTRFLPVSWARRCV